MNKILIPLTMILLTGCAQSSKTTYAAFDKDGNIIAGDKNFKSVVDRNAVREVVKSVFHEIKNCHNVELKLDPKSEGRLDINFEVVNDKVTKIKVRKKEAGISQNLAECVMKVISQKQFPTSPKDNYYEVDYPFIFGKDKKDCPDKSKMVRVYQPTDGPYLNGDYDVYCNEDELFQSRKSLMPDGNK